MSDQYLVGSEVQWLWQQNSSGAAALVVATHLVVTLDWQQQKQRHQPYLTTVNCGGYSITTVQDIKNSGSSKRSN